MAILSTNESDGTDIERVEQTETASTSLNTNEILPDSEPLESASPVSRLPIEMLREIFFHLYYTLPRRWDVKYEAYFDWCILPLTRVCRLWRIVIISTPSFWTKIDLEQSDFAALCIERSRTLPLSVQVLPHPHWKANTEELEKWRNPLLDASLAATLSQRATALNSAIKWNDMTELFDMLQSGDWQRLEKLCLALYYTEDPITMTNFPSINLTRWSNHLSGIRHISLSAFMMPFCSVFYGPNLTTVVIEKFNAVIGIDQLIEFIRDHPLLERLSIHGIRGSKAGESHEFIPRFTHRKLSLLSLKDFLEPSAMYHLFDKVFTDAYVELTYDADADFSIELCPPEHPLKQRLQLLHQICVYLAPSSLIFGHFTGPKNFLNFPIGLLDAETRDVIHFRLRPQSHHPLITFANQYGSPHCKSLVIKFGPFWFDDTDTAEWTAILEPFPNLESIRVHFNKRGANATSLFEALATGNCPNMKHIFLDDVSQKTSFEVMQKYTQLRSLRDNGQALLDLWLNVTEIFRVVDAEDTAGWVGARKVHYEAIFKPWVRELNVNVSPYLLGKRW